MDNHFIFSLAPESFFRIYKIIPKKKVNNFPFLERYSDGLNIAGNRIALAIILFLICLIYVAIYSFLRRKNIIKGLDYTIIVEYGDLFKKKNGKIIIPFDECYTTSLGEKPFDIKEDSICGQYLKMNPDLDIKDLIKESELVPRQDRSLFRGKLCYEPGTLISNNEYLLMAFTRLDKDGRSLQFTLGQYIDCLSKMWHEIDKYSCGKDFYIPLIGSGYAKFDSGNNQAISKQDLIELIIYSYKNSPYKLKSNSLHIVCLKSKDFNINSIH